MPMSLDCLSQDEASETIPLVRRPRRARPSKPAVSSPPALSKIGQQPDPEAVDVVRPLVGFNQLRAPTEVGVVAPTEAGVVVPNEARVAVPTEEGVAASTEMGFAAPTEAGVAAPDEVGIAAPTEAGIAAPDTIPLAEPEATAETPVHPYDVGLSIPPQEVSSAYVRLPALFIF